MTCVAGLHFNTETGTCVWPDMANRVGCGSNANSQLDRRCLEINNLSTYLSLTEKLSDGFQCPKDYPKADKNGQSVTHPNFPHPEDCTKFYICLNGVEPRHGNCDAGLVYNEDLQRCDEPENVPGW